MELVINIDEDVRIAITRMGLLRIPDEMQKKVDKAIQHGTPLPKGHGRLFDERDIVNGNYEVIGNKIYKIEPIIEADVAEDKKHDHMTVDEFVELFTESEG